jgi:8-oxo-dGTP pyrophosphatase MutT (NUDIX family)
VEPGDVAPRAPTIIPADRLPPGFAEQVERPTSDPAPAKPAATAVLMRDAAGSTEVLLLRRHRSSGFVPGAYVFPGGRVDDADADPELLAWTRGVPPAAAPAAYAFAAIREVFEETGVLLAVDEPGAPPPDDDEDPALGEWREALLVDRATLMDVLRATGRRLAADALVHIAHWITPVAEPRRYDTRFFLAGLPPGCSTRADAREMTDERWIRPADALDEFHAGRLPMVFPTVRTIELLAPFPTVAEAVAALRGRTVEPVQPRLVRTPEGVGLVVD